MTIAICILLLVLLVIVALTSSQIPLAVSGIVIIWLLYKRKTINKTFCTVAIAILVLFTPMGGIPKDGSGSFTLRSIMYTYEKTNYYDLYTKTYYAPSKTSFKFFPFNLIGQ